MNLGMVGMMILMAIGWLVVLAALVGAVWWLARRFGTREDEALEELRDRDARGEITREEFEAQRKDLAA